MSKLYLALFCILYLCSFISAFEINTFQDGTSTDTIFLNNSQTKYLNIPQYSQILTASIEYTTPVNQHILDVPYWVYYGLNVTTYRGLFYIAALNPQNANDGDIVTAASIPVGTALRYGINFSVDNTAVAGNVTLWAFQGTFNSLNLSCYNWSNNKWTFINYHTANPTTHKIFDGCFNGEQINFYIYDGIVNAKELLEIRLELQNATNPSINTSIGTDVINTTNKNGIIDLLASDILQNYINSATPAPITITASNATNLTYSNINITYNNRLNIQIKDEQTDLPILTNVTVIHLSNTGETSYITNTGYLQINNSFDGYNTFRFLSNTYAQRDYILNFVNGYSQNLTAYLTTSNETVIFTFKDQDGGQVLENVLLNTQRNINASWQTVYSKYSDITGRVQINYVEGERYRFIASADDYITKTWLLDPILFNTYTVKLSKGASRTFEYAYEGVNFGISPHEFNNNARNNIVFTLFSPAATLLSYTFFLDYPGGANITSGTNPLGETAYLIFNISNATLFSTVNVTLYYQTNLSNNTFTYKYTINDPNPASGTWLKNKESMGDLGLFERFLIVTIGVLILAGLATFVMGDIIGGLVGILALGFSVALGFIPLWAVLPSIFVGFILIATRSSE